MTLGHGPIVSQFNINKGLMCVKNENLNYRQTKKTNQATLMKWHVKISSAHDKRSKTITG